MQDQVKDYLDANITQLKLLKLSVDRKLLKPPKKIASKWPRKAKLEPIQEEEQSQKNYVFGQPLESPIVLPENLRPEQPGPFESEPPLLEEEEPHPEDLVAALQVLDPNRNIEIRPPPSQP